MQYWGLIAEGHTGYRDYKRWNAAHLGTVYGTREQAMATLLESAKQFRPEHPRKPMQRWIYRTGDGYIAFVRGATETFPLRFSLAELVYDSGAQ